MVAINVGGRRFLRLLSEGGSFLMRRTMKAAYTLFVVCGMAGSALGPDCERDYRIMLGASEEESASAVVSEVPA